MTTTKHTSNDYEDRYRKGFGLVYPESHVIRVYKHIIEYELGITTGNVLDFGCGVGGNLKYFVDQGFVPYGCDTSETAIDQCKHVMPEHADHFHVSDVQPKLSDLFPGVSVNIFLANQVLYYFNDADIRDIVSQVHDLTAPGGVFVASMMAYSHWYVRFITGEEGDFKRVDMDTPRQASRNYINFKDREELEPLFAPFRKLHVGSYGSHIREEEGSIDHWLYVGIRA